MNPVWLEAVENQFDSIRFIPIHSEMVIRMNQN